MNEFKIATHLNFLIGFLSSLLLLIGGMDLRGISQANDALKTVLEDRTEPTGQLAEVINRLNLRSGWSWPMT